MISRACKEFENLCALGESERVLLSKEADRTLLPSLIDILLYLIAVEIKLAFITRNKTYSGV